MHDERDLARRAVMADLFGPEPFADARRDPGSDVASGMDGVVPPERYELVRRLGRGGAGVVYLARDRALDRPVALKFLADLGPGALERFRREARFAARLDDPAIVRVLDLGEAPSGPYIALEYVDGGSLADASLDPRSLARALAAAARALQHAHDHGIVHRDIKPANLLLDASGRVRVTDFGVALDRLGESGPTLSLHGQVLGTPAAMSPEQARGALHAVDARSDVYALGATLYHGLSGRWPFEGDGVVEVLHAVMHDAPAPLDEVAPQAPAALRAIAHRCLRKRPEDRYPSMARLAEALERAAAGEAATDAAPESSPESAQPVWTPPAGSAESFETLGMAAAREILAWDVERYRVSRRLDRAYARLDPIVARLSAHLERRPDAAWARFLRGLAQFRRGELRAALDDMEGSVDRASILPGAFFELGRLYLAVHLEEQRTARRHVHALGLQWHLDSARDRLEQAAVAFREARRSPVDAPPWQRRYGDAVARLAEDDFPGCVAVCDAILELDPDAEDVWKLRGDAQGLLGEDPRESYAHAVAIRRGFFEAWIARAEHELRVGDLAGARASLERAREIHPGVAEAWVLSARVALAEHRAGPGATVPAGASAPASAPAPARTPARAPSQSRAADVVGAANDRLNAAIGASDTALRLRPGAYEALVLRAECRLELHRGGGASPEALGSALDDLAEAASRPGCQNRVRLLRAQVLVARARALLERATTAAKSAPGVGSSAGPASEDECAIAETNPNDPSYVSLCAAAADVAEALRDRDAEWRHAPGSAAWERVIAEADRLAERLRGVGLADRLPRAGETPPIGG